MMVMGHCKCIVLCLLFVFVHLISCSLSCMGDFKIATLNINGARDFRKRAKLFELMKQKHSDVMFIQETHSDEKNAADWVREWEGKTFLSHKTSVSGGVGLLFSKNFVPQSYSFENIIEGRLLKVRAVFDKCVFVFMCVYAPSTGVDRMIFLDQLCNALKNCKKDEYLFLSGDFNCTEANIDRNHPEPHSASRKKLIELINMHELSDIWRNFNGQRQYTWAHARDNFLSMARLDRVYSFKHHVNVFRNCKIFPVMLSDHSMVQSVVGLKYIKPMSAYWHLNTSLLSDAHFKDVFIFFWTSFRETKSSFESLQQWWDFGKIQIRQLCQQYTASVTSDINKSMNRLELEIVQLQDMAESTGDSAHIEVVKTKKVALADLLDVRAQGALVRSRYQNVAQMDAPSKFFFGLERKNGQAKCMHALLSESGSLSVDPAEIRRIAVKFYASLYTSEYTEKPVMENYFFDDLPKIPEDSVNDLETAFSLDELTSALQSMDCGRASGIDGLPVEFYRCFWTDLGGDLLEVLNDSIDKGQLPKSCKRAVLTLLPKKGNLQDIKNWRPVALLCCDYKLLSKSLSNRLRKVIGKVIHSDQAYCVPSRCIFDNITLVRDFLELSKALNLDAGLISLDQEKAFDRVEREYLWKTLAAFGFSPVFIDKIKVLYCDAESILKINGGLCSPFKVLRGVRQGCALSGMLYSLAIEPLLHKLRMLISGFTVPCSDSKLLLSAYADDVVVIVKSQKDIEHLIKTVSDFGKISSAKVNWNKSEALLIGKWDKGEILTFPQGLSVVKEGFKYLGVFLGDKQVQMKNWDGVLEKVKGRLGRWSWLLPKMSYRGRILICNNLVASSLWHRLMCIDPPPGLISNIQSLIVDFFWDKLHWIPQSVLFLPKEEGGQGLVHLASRVAAFRLQFLQRLLYGPNDLVWRPLACTLLKSLGGLDMDRSLFLMDPRTLSTQRLPCFYCGVFKVLSLFKIQREASSSLCWLLQEPLIRGARLDVSAGMMPSLDNILSNKGVNTLRDLVTVTGPTLNNAENLSSILGIRSLRIVTQFLNKVKDTLTEREKVILQSFNNDAVFSDDEDFFPLLNITPDYADCVGTYLEAIGLNLELTDGKVFYKACVKVLNKQKLNSRVDTPWRRKLNLDDNVKPAWRALYKPPLTKKFADLQWKILHGIVAVNSFVSVINPAVDDKCPFCVERETVFHCFMECERLGSLLCRLQLIFRAFKVVFTKNCFILGVMYMQKKKSQCQLLNFITGQAKMAIWISRRNALEGVSGQDCLHVFFKIGQVQNDDRF